MKKIIHRTALCGAAACLAILAGCSTGGNWPPSPSNITQARYGTTPDGKAVEIYTLRNSKGAEARIITYGGIVVSLKMPDKSGDFGDVVLGCNSLEDYEKATTYFGALIGRYGNRIGKATFTLDGATYHLPPNNNGNTLHGGDKGFDKVVWNAQGRDSLPPGTQDMKPEPRGPQLILTYTSKDGEEGFPGTLNVTAVYTLTEDNELQIDFTATTDKDTVVNLTHHSYFNLAGKGDILGHIVTIPADKITPVDAGLIPTGEIAPVAGTPFDFRNPTAIGLRVDQTNSSEQLKFGPGYDHNWVFDKKVGDLSRLARVSEPTTGRVLEVWSTEPALQFYSGNFLDGTITGKGGWVYQKHAAFCMEPQHYPDSPNKPQFPSTELKPGQTYHNTIIYRFSVAN
ncbi:MAG: aldose epimerase family protein [Verrucomicrobiota bacterium]|jgi:aldose 1-epimerase